MSDDPHDLGSDVGMISLTSGATDDPLDNGADRSDSLQLVALSHHKSPQESGMIPVFIGGPGRSGTTILKTILRKHPSILGFPWELRFLTDSGGLLDLAMSLSERWTPYALDAVFRSFHRMVQGMGFPKRFVRMFHGWIPQRYRRLTFPPYTDMSIEAILALPPGQLEREVLWLIQQAHIRPYAGWWLGSRGFRLRRRKLGPFVSRIWFAPRMDPVESRLLVRAFVERLVSGSRFRTETMSYWIDDTPQNAQRAAELRAVFSEAKFIHIVRDPLDNISSLKNEHFAPPDVLSCALWVRSSYEAWDAQKKLLPSGSYYEMTLEELVADPNRALDELCGFLGLPMHPNLLDVDLSRHNIGRHKKDLTQSERDTAISILGYYS